MLKTSRQIAGKLLPLQSTQQLALVNARFFSHPMWNAKTRHEFKPKYFDNENFNLDRRWDVK